MKSLADWTGEEGGGTNGKFPFPLKAGMNYARSDWKSASGAKWRVDPLNVCLTVRANLITQGSALYTPGRK
jgi:hypothetical protein